MIRPKTIRISLDRIYTGQFGVRVRRIGAWDILRLPWEGQIFCAPNAVSLFDLARKVLTVLRRPARPLTRW